MHLRSCPDRHLLPIFHVGTKSGILIRSLSTIRALAWNSFAKVDQGPHVSLPTYLFIVVYNYIYLYKLSISHQQKIRDGIAGINKSNSPPVCPPVSIHLGHDKADEGCLATWNFAPRGWHSLPWRDAARGLVWFIWHLTNPCLRPSLTERTSAVWR